MIRRATSWRRTTRRRRTSAHPGECRRMRSFPPSSTTAPPSGQRKTAYRGACHGQGRIRGQKHLPSCGRLGLGLEPLQPRLLRLLLVLYAAFGQFGHRVGPLLLFGLHRPVLRLPPLRAVRPSRPGRRLARDPRGGGGDGRDGARPSRIVCGRAPSRPLPLVVLVGYLTLLS